MTVQAPEATTTFYDLLRAVVGNLRWCEAIRVDVGRVGELGLCFDVSADGAGIGTFTADEVAARATLEIAALEDLCSGYGDHAP